MNYDLALSPDDVETFCTEHYAEKIAEKDMRTAIQLAEIRVASELEKKAAEKDAQIERLKVELKSSAELIQANVKGDLRTMPR